MRIAMPTRLSSRSDPFEFCRAEGFGAVDERMDAQANDVQFLSGDGVFVVVPCFDDTHKSPFLAIALSS